jgi:hypothetical protein
VRVKVSYAIEPEILGVFFQRTAKGNKVKVQITNSRNGLRRRACCQGCKFGLGRGKIPNRKIGNLARTTNVMVPRIEARTSRILVT